MASFIAEHDDRPSGSLAATWWFSADRFNRNDLPFYQSWLVVWATPLKNMKVNWDDDIPNIWENKKCSKPPTRISSNDFLAQITHLKPLNSIRNIELNMDMEHLPRMSNGN